MRDKLAKMEKSLESTTQGKVSILTHTLALPVKQSRCSLCLSLFNVSSYVKDTCCDWDTQMILEVSFVNSLKFLFPG